MTEPPRTVLAGGHAAFRAALAAALDVPVLGVALDELDNARASLTAARRSVCWVHLVPSAGEDGGAAEAVAEASLLLQSAAAARALARSAGVPLAFIAVLPMPGMFVGPGRMACDVALTAMTSLMRAEIGDWSSDGCRIAGLVYAGIEGNEPPGQRPLEEIRRRTPMGTLGTFAQLAQALRFVASDAATYITGTLLRVDGGCDAYSWVYPARTI